MHQWQILQYKCTYVKGLLATEKGTGTVVALSKKKRPLHMLSGLLRICFAALFIDRFDQTFLGSHFSDPTYMLAAFITASTMATRMIMPMLFLLPENTEISTPLCTSPSHAIVT